ncbi:hypothetical protein [Bosea sp. CS1GBMeth4]|uniref:hypothetical protein n=1 Tax=Bosea sp. CS1GBMeth4 TaxID=1892849 RepID=UPI001647D9A9|nr:hypothetical protein [Bosea sp. CS1GBMeth4]
MSDIIIDANTLRHIGRGNRSAAEALRKMLASGRKVYIATAAYNEVVHGIDPPLNQQYRQLLEDLDIRVPPASRRADMIKPRGDVYADNIQIAADPPRNAPGAMTEYGGRRDPVTGLKSRPGDVFVAAEAKALDAELFTLDDALARRARAQGVRIAPESSIPASPGPEDVMVARQLLRDAAPAARLLSLNGLKASLLAAKAAFKTGLIDAFAAPSLASLIPDVVLAIADKVAVRDAIRRIQTKFIKEGFAKGVAAGVMGWTEEEVKSNLLNRVSHFRVRGLGDAAGTLKLPYILQVAEVYENYAVNIGFLYSSSKSLEWKKAIRDKGFETLRKRGYRFEGGEAMLFEFDFVDKLAFVIHHETDAMVARAIRYR